MQGSVILILLMCICGNLGLDLTIDLTGPESHGDRKVCGIVDCSESVKLSDSSLTSSQKSNDSLAKTITGMTIVKRTKLKSNNETEQQDHHVASLTLQQPRITRESDSMKIDGVLQADKTYMRLELTKREDCLSEFSCEVRFVDRQGNEFGSSNRLGLHHRQNASHVETGREMAAPPRQAELIALLLSTSLSDKLGSMENRLEDKIRLVEDKLISLEGNINDKIESSHDDIGSLRHDLKSFFSTVKDREDCDPGSKAEPEALLATLWEGIQKTQDSLLKDSLLMTARVLDMLNETKLTVSEVEGHVMQLKTSEPKDQLCVNDLERTVGEISNISKDLSQREENNALLLQNTIKSKFVEVQSMCSKSIKDFSIVHHLLKQTSSVLLNDIQPAVDLLRPRICRKIMEYVPIQSPFPYLVVHPSKGSDLNVPYLCDTVTQGGGWILIQRRTTGNLDFFLDWASYKKGFGSLDDDFWLGNDNIHTLTSQGKYELRVEIKYKNVFKFAHYASFSIGNEENSYALNLGSYDGTAGDSLTYSNRWPFSTVDKDNDGSTQNCALKYGGAWWYKHCYESNLNGKWNNTSVEGLRWNTVSTSESATFSEMKIRLLG